MHVFFRRIALFREVARGKGIRPALHMIAAHVRYRVLQGTFHFWQSLGVHVTPVHFYEPVPDTRELRQRKGLWESESELVGIEMNVDEQLTLAREVFPSFAEEYKFPRQKTQLPFEFYLDNGYFGDVDAEVAHCMVRHFLPRTIIEIGSGYSTRLLARACLLNRDRSGRETQLVTVDPYPDNTVAKGIPGLTMLLRQKAEDTPLSFFSQLYAGDILFIDSSHVVRTYGDVNYLFLEVLPRLKAGVIVHVHDVFLPREYPEEWVVGLRRFWSEQYLLQAFLTYNCAYSVLWCGSHMHRHYPQELKAVFPSYDGLRLPSSFWMHRKT